ncbi:MAG: APC family permease [Myxococcota bacterium]
MEAHPRDRLKRELTLTDTTFLVVASVIGAGIFFTPGQVAALLPSPGWIFAAWGFGALISLAGALTNAELGAMYPRAGGDYVFLREAFHPLAGFLVGWLTFFAIYAGSIAALAAAFGAGLSEALGWEGRGSLAIAVGVTVLVSGANYVGVRWGARANNLTSVLKIAALAAFVILGPSVGVGDPARFFAAAAGPITITAFALAMSPVLFSYLGWNASLYVGSEIRDPGRNLPRSLFLGLFLCAVLYPAINAVYLYAIPMEVLRGSPDAGRAAAGFLFGPIAGGLVGTFVLVSILGTLNATVLVGPRIAYAMGLDGLFLPGADTVHPRFGTPARAIVLQGAVAVAVLLLLRSFPAVLDFTIFAILLAALADVAALLRLRRTQPDRPRPYKAWGFPLTPLFYAASMAGVAGVMLVERSLESFVAIVAMLAGIPFYRLFRRRSFATRP